MTDVVHFCGSRPNEELMSDMQKHEIFLFTSDRNEGWGQLQTNVWQMVVF